MIRTDPTDDNFLDSFRHEVKASYPDTWLETIRSLVRSHPAGFSAAYPPRQVNNIYFDTPSWNNLEDNLAGISERHKVRLRWYGDNLTSIAGVLELKQKSGACNRKITRPLQQHIDLTNMSWSRILAQIGKEDLGPLLPYVMSHCLPAIINKYQREYMVSADGLVRLTVDTHLTFYTQTMSHRPNLRYRQPNTPLLVVELKGSANQYKRIIEILRSFPFRQTAFSKYARGVLGEF